MLYKVAGALLLSVAAFVLLKVLFKVLGMVFSAMVVLLGVALAAVLAYLGWRLLHR